MANSFFQKRCNRRLYLDTLIELNEYKLMQQKGVYILLLRLHKSAAIKTRSRKFKLDPGYYAYVGSAMGGLKARINRHLAKEKRKHCHIDYLLEETEIKTVLSAQTNNKVECQIALKLSKFSGPTGFGCSDCGCKSHLFYCADFDTLFEKATQVLESAGLQPFIQSEFGIN